VRWDLVDYFEVLEKGRRACARKTFTGKEDFFLEHHPQQPLVPEPFFIEMVAQAGGVLFGLGLDFKKDVILVKIADARFESPVAPPCECRIEARIEEEREDGAWIEGTVKVEEETVAAVKILLAATDLSEQTGKPQVVFSETFLSHYRIREIASGVS